MSIIIKYKSLYSNIGRQNPSTVYDLTDTVCNTANGTL